MAKEWAHGVCCRLQAAGYRWLAPARVDVVFVAGARSATVMEAEPASIVIFLFALINFPIRTLHMILSHNDVGQHAMCRR